MPHPLQDLLTAAAALALYKHNSHSRCAVTLLSDQGRSHSRTVPSRLPDTSSLPSLLRARPVTLPVCPSRVAFSRPVTVSHTLTVSSPPCDATRLPSPLIATAVPSACPLKTAFSRPATTSHSRTASSSLPDATSLLPPLPATPVTCSVCPPTAALTRPLATAHSLAVLPLPP